MLDKERQDRIIQFLRQKVYASVHELSELTETSEATVRRDLTKLEDGGQIHRVRGGAELSPSRLNQTQTPRELPLSYRAELYTPEKKRIAKAASELCSNGETIFIDGGSTTLHMAPHLLANELQIVTNSFAIARELLKTGNNRIILPGGMLYPDSELILNPFGEEAYSGYLASKVFIGAGAITESGIMNNDMLIIHAEKAMIEHGRDIVVLADSSKFLQQGRFVLCDFERISAMITDSNITERHRKMMADKGIRLLTV